ncbi:hypothetical protein BDW67DRAFT_193752 [Aspergillus spinulosporus]
MTQGSEDLTIIRAENIALFSLLHSVTKSAPFQSVPVPPSSNPLEPSPLGQEDYILSLLRERNLASTLAFLAQTKDDADHVPAVCIEQSTDLNSLNVLIAVNRCRWEDGDSILHALRDGFEKIFSVLARVPDRRDDHCTVESDVFTEIVHMCSSRILQRLGLASIEKKACKKPKARKKPIKDMLRDVIQCIKRLNVEGILDKELESDKALFTAKATEVISLVDLWYGHQTAPRLSDLVEGVHRLSQIGKLHLLLDQIPNRDMVPSMKKSLLNVISKVAKYRDSARFLYRTAKKVPIARRMNVTCVKLPREAFDYSLAREYIPDLLLTLSRIDRRYMTQKASKQVWRLLDTTHMEASDDFSMQVRKTLKGDTKIHAEIQLIAYCELNMPRYKTRVICSSKDACFLCSSFIHMHGKVHIPRSHGRLYPGWRLPLLPVFREMERHFNGTLETCIKKSLSTLIQRRQKTIYPFPCESTLLTLPISETTRHSSEQHERVTQPSSLKSPKTNDSFISSTGIETARLSTQCSNRERLVSPTISDLAGVRDTLQPDRSSSVNNQQPPPIHRGSDECGLFQGLKVSNSLDSGAQSPHYIADSLRIQIEYPAGLRNIGYSIEWLADKEAIRIQNERNLVPVIDADTLASEISLRDQNCIYVVTKRVTVRLDWDG